MYNILVILGRTGINGTPPEILSEIFIHCLPIDSTSYSTLKRLSSVCRHWRTVVLATPALWSSLDIICNKDVLRPPLSIIRTHLQRSGTRPLSIIIRGEEYTDKNNPRVLSILVTLATARQRWDNVEIRLRGMTQDILDFITQGDAPFLRSMKYDISPYIEGLPIPLSMVQNYPRLESFGWDGPGPILLPLVDTQLTSLSLVTSLSVSECVALLHLSPRLSSAKFHCNRQSVGPSPDSHFTHPALCTLSIEGDYSNTLLDSLILPALMDLELKIQDTSTPPSEWGIPLATFLERSNPPLHNLSLRMDDVPLEPTFVRILTSTPHLRVFKMTRRLLVATLPAGLIRALHPQAPPGTPLCPHLRRLELEAVSDCPDGLCGAMLRARWGADACANGVACLERADIEVEDGDHYRDLEDMAELRADGMLGRICWDDMSGSRMPMRIRIHYT